MPSPDTTTRSLLRLLLYYALLITGTLVLARYWPALHNAVSIDLPTGAGGPDLPLPSTAQSGAASTPVATALAMTGALALAAPVAWVYMLSKRRQRWDPSVVQTVILLPLVVAGIAALVRNSLALAFSLAGLAAAVRFRNTLKDTKDAVYIFLAIAIGLAAGVQALALAFVVSILFNGAVIALWAFNVGDIYAGEPRPAFTSEFLVVDPERADGFLVVQADRPTQERIEAALPLHVSHWKMVKRGSGDSGRVSLTYVVRLRKRMPPTALVAAVVELGASAEFQPRTD